MSYDSLLVGLVLIVLAFLFYWVFSYSHRLEQTSYVGEILGRALFSVERQRRISEIEEAWQRGKYHMDAVNDETWRSEHPLPTRPGGDSFLIDIAVQQLEQQGRVGTLPPFGTQDEQTTKYLSELRSWEKGVLEKKANGLRSTDIRRCEEQAQTESQKALGVIDLATLRGRGPEFILQFTAVVTIVFVVLALGLVGKLDSQQAGTILAAIAGYVLGQATSRGQARPREAPEPSSPENLKPTKGNLSVQS